MLFDNKTPTTYVKTFSIERAKFVRIINNTLLYIYLCCKDDLRSIIQRTMETNNI